MILLIFIIKDHKFILLTGLFLIHFLNLCHFKYQYIFVIQLSHFNFFFLFKEGHNLFILFLN